MSTQTILLIDGHSLAYRAYYALPPENFATTTGQTTNAVYGFVSMLLTAVENEQPSHIAVAFDLGRQTFRLEEYPEYKAGRAKTPDDFHGQVGLIKDVLAALGVPVLEEAGYEADDLLASMARTATGAGLNTEIATGDKDSFQLASDTVTILYPKRGFTDLMRMTPAAVEEKYGVTPANYRGLAALVGEKADNLPGVPGVGEKTAAKWLTQHTDLPGVLAAAGDIKGKVGDSLRAHLGDVERNYRLNKLVDDVALDLDLDDARLGRGDREKVSELFDQLEFRALGKRLSPAFFGDDAASQPAAEISLPEVRAADSAALTEFLTQAGEGHLGVAVDTDGAARIALARAEDIITADLSALDEAAFNALDEFLSTTAAAITHNAKPQVEALMRAGFAQLRPHTDTELAAYLLVPDQRSYELTDLARAHLGLELDTAEADGQLDLDGSGGTKLGHSAWAALKLAPVLRDRLEANHTLAVLDDIERPTQEILIRMELAGIKVNRDHLAGLRGEFEAQAGQSAADAYQAIGHEVNLGSPKQLQAVLFDELDMPKTKKTKTGYTTDADALADLFIKTGHPFLEHLLAYRDRTKLKQTVVGLEKVVAEDGRIHTTYLQTVAATGRLSSKDPNLQNIPVRTEAGRRIREAFEPEFEAGYESLMSADYSQIEMRIMAHLSGDEALIAAFNAGEDLHRYVAAQVYQIPTAEVTDAQRSKVKAMSYGLVYGLSAFGLSRQLGITPIEARELMDTYFERFGAVKEYLDGIVDEARIRGYTETMYGRRRYLPALTSDRRQLREMAERAALNAPIQGSAADIMKIAMRRVDSELAAAQLKSRMLLQVHDEIIVEIASGEYDRVAQIVTREMGSAAELSVPLDVNLGHGENWQAAAH